MKPHGFHAEADAEYAEAVLKHARISSRLGVRFYEEIERLIRELRRRPAVYRFFRKPVRRHFSARYHYAVLYVDRPDDVWIVAVMDMRRSPDLWAHRLD